MHLSLADARQLVVDVLVRSDTTEDNARCVAAALVAAEADGIPSHGLSRVPFYADQARSGKVDGRAVPAISRPRSAVILADARFGFAFPAIHRGIEAALEIIRETGVVLVLVGRSHHAGVGGYHVEMAARRGCVALAFFNTPSAMAPWGGTRGTLGTNPIAFACPRADASPLVIDMSLSAVARGKIVQARGQSGPIPEGWARDAHGHPTRDAAAALEGTMEPFGGAKGAVLALMVEILAAGLSGSNFAFEASSFFEPAGRPPGVGQTLILIDPLAGPGQFDQRLVALTEEILAQPGTRLPGDRRRTRREQAMSAGIEISTELYADLRRRAGLAAPATGSG